MGSNERKRRGFTKFLVVLALILGGCAYGLYYFFTTGSSTILVTFNSSSRSSEPFQLEVVATPETRHKGLMYRRELDADKGMIFVFPTEKVQAFWMKDTYIPLDMIFVNEARKVVGIINNVPIMNEERRSVEAASMYVIELQGGAAERAGIKVNDILSVSSRVLPRALR